jgi:uncharacterized membrane protein
LKPLFLKVLVAIIFNLLAKGMIAAPVPNVYRGLESLIPLNSMKVQEVVSLLEGIIKETKKSHANQSLFILNFKKYKSIYRIRNKQQISNSRRK